MNSGFFALDGQCIAFPQDISDVCNTLPRKQSDLVTYIRKTGNKNTSAVKLKHLRVRRKRVLDALNWLKIHNSEYKSINIAEERLDWMDNKDEAMMSDNVNILDLEDPDVPKDQQPVVAKVQCLGDLEPSNDLEFATMAINDNRPGIRPEQGELMKQLVDATLDAGQAEKLLHFPPHGDTPLRYVL